MMFLVAGGIVLIISRSSIEGSTSGFVSGTLAVYENQALERVDYTDFFEWPPL